MLYGVEVTPEKVVEVCRVVGLHDRIMRLRKGYDTRFGVGGIDVARSDVERLAIVRLLVRDPKIVLLGASLSHVDPRS